MRTQSNSLEQLESRYDLVLTDLDELLSRIDSTILKNKPVTPIESPTSPESTPPAFASE